MKPKNPEAKKRNVSIDPEVQELLNEAQDKLAGVFGFRPTISQTIRYLVKKGANP